MADDEATQDFKNLELVQSMIDISAERLEGLRTKCATSAELTQQEIRTLEGKLVKMFSRQLVEKAKLRTDDLKNIPSLTQWLQVVGLSSESVRAVCQRVATLEELKEKSEHELRSILGDGSVPRPEELGRLHRALHNLRRYTEVLLRGDGAQTDSADMPLYWDSWDRHHHHHHHYHQQQQPLRNNLSPRVGRSRGTRASVPSEESLPTLSSGTVHVTNGTANNGLTTTLAPSCSISSISSLILSSRTGRCSPTPPLTPPVLSKTGKAGDRVKFPTTPPPRKRHLTGVQANALLPDAYPLTKSKSHESQLAAGRDAEDQQAGRRARLPTEPGPASPPSIPSVSATSPVRSPPLPHEEGVGGGNKVQVAPKSPRTPTVSSRGMGHVIAHRFTKTFKVMTVCNFCNRQMFGTGLKCKECKYKCHRECEPKVPPSCGLPQEFVDEFKRSFQSDVFQPDTRQSPSQLRAATCSPNNGGGPIGLLPSFRHPHKRNGTHHHQHHHHHYHQQQQQSTSISTAPDSSSNTSSCNSSTPSSPALLGVTLTPHSLARQQFHFPDVAATDTETEAGSPPLTDTALQVPTVRSQDEIPAGERGGAGNCASPGGAGVGQGERVPVRVDSQDSQVSDGETSGVERDGSHRWPRQNSLSMREWDIPFDELKIGEQIGRGRFGTVYRGNWHGDVAIKVLNMDYLDDEKALETFRAEVGTFRKTRHENLMLFMGACMKPPRLAIVTSLSRGNTLYTHIHLRKDKFNVTRTTIIAQQVSQGMGYLHAKDIVHKDLKSKNIFLENGKVVIADFGLFSVTKLCYGNRKGDSLGIPPGWLCYLAPEIVRSLRAHQAHDEELPFSKASDVYAFGTVWYELLCGEWPFKGQPPESIIWQVGKGMKQPLANLQASRDVKDILMLCWSFRPADRPDFICLLNTLNKLPKKRLTRSPSHPIHLSRSAESVF